MSNRGSTTRVYVGNLPENIKEREVEDIFYKFGRIKDIDIKYGRASNGTTYAFLEFDNPRDAEEAVDRRDGYKMFGERLRVEFTGERRPKWNKNQPHGPPKRTTHRVLVRGLPSSASWQDLKDHMRQAGSVGYANIEGGVGVVEYEHRSDMEWALRKLNGSIFKNMYHRVAIKVREERQESRSRSASLRSDEDRHYAENRYRSRSPPRSRNANRYSRSRSHSNSYGSDVGRRQRKNQDYPRDRGAPDTRPREATSSQRKNRSPSSRRASISPEIHRSSLSLNHSSGRESLGRKSSLSPDAKHRERSLSAEMKKFEGEEEDASPRHPSNESPEERNASLEAMNGYRGGSLSKTNGAVRNNRSASAASSYSDDRVSRSRSKSESKNDYASDASSDA
ncbi:splicing factor SF2 [Cardiosporidium cionae]|uniref:Splicing factor SF2 n=1 Tax=Cardiosporidium cionae TaxID=476202 RepID=A0ABQ7J778_9APIC|nr:splicing factor SF2 [Cardiosporidium cionae]|eukprot:KAF8819831.1 splicing factor SF2 [Cardiosporidium cionae]